MMDISDGLAKDVHALAPRDTEARLDAKAIPYSTAARAAARTSGRTWLQHALEDGEDYELVFTLDRHADPHSFAKKWNRRFPLRLSCIGRFCPISATTPGLLSLDGYHGYEHLGPT